MCRESDRTPDKGALKYVYAANGKKYNFKGRLRANDNVIIILVSILGLDITKLLKWWLDRFTKSTGKLLIFKYH